MPLHTPTSPHIHSGITVTTVMLRVLLALVPGIAAYIWLFGTGVLINIVLAMVFALGAEAVMLKLRGRPLLPFLTDGSVVVTAVLFALTLPPLAPWWLSFLGILFAVVIGKHLFGGLGHNPFNPAMLGYVMLLISFPREMTMWAPPLSLATHPLAFADTLAYVFLGHLPDALSLDAVTMATPLDHVKTEVSRSHEISAVMSGSPLFGTLAGTGWEWLGLAYLAGGLWLIKKRIIGWQIPAAMLGALALMAAIFYAVDNARYASPLFHLLSGGALLGAFFIATDPVTAATTPRGRLYYGAGIGVLVYVIRTWGGYPDAVAFAVLLMNIAAPTIDHYTQPRVFGHRKD